MAQKIKVSVSVKVPKEAAWDYFNLPEHITGWNFALPDWHCPRAESDFRESGKFTLRMESKDGGVGFDFSGVFTEIEQLKGFNYTLDDGRKVSATFEEDPEGTLVTEIFEADAETPPEIQQQGWQNILNNFKKYAESR